MKGRFRLALVGLLISACSDRDPAGLEPANESVQPAGVSVSNPLARAAVTHLSGSRSSVGVATDANFAYISVAPQTFPSGIVADIRNVTTKSEPRRVRITDGGWDPVALEATADDEIELKVWLDRGATILTIKVPRRRSPTVVRSNPPKGRVDVALNQLVTVVFSEPIDPTSLNSTSFQLQLNRTPVAGSIRIASDGLTAEFLSDQALQPGVTYDLAVTQSVKDLDGDPLADEYTSSFTTERTPLATAECSPDALFLCVVAGTYALVSVNDQALPVHSPWGIGDWDYDLDAGTWQLTNWTITLYAEGVFSQAMTHRAASGATIDDTDAAWYARSSDSVTFYVNTNAPWSAAVSGNSLIYQWSDGTKFTFERL
jgi:hypothetical protein